MNLPEQPLTLRELPERRKNTELVSELLQKELLSCVTTLSPLLTPERAVVKYSGSRTDVSAVEKAYEQFLQDYKSATGRPFDAPREFDSDWVTGITARPELYRWEYPYEIQSDRGAKTITMTSPRRWVLNYPSAYGFAQLRQAVTGREKQFEHLRQFVINSLVLQLAISKTNGLTALFEALRFRLAFEQLPELSKLPLVTITSSIPSFRPPDELILAATEFSGVPAFIELIDTDSIDRWEDPLKIRIQEILTAPGA